MQSLLDHTATRSIASLGEVIETLTAKDENMTLISKRGCDGSQQVQYWQKFQNDSDSDANIFQSSFVPLLLVCSENNKLLWQNPTPSSP